MDLKDRFLPLLGQWTGLEEQEAIAGTPATTARASFVFRLDVAGTVVVQDYRQVRADGGELVGHGVFCAEPGTEQLLWWFFDSDARPPLPATGVWQGAELVLERGSDEDRAQHRFRPAGDELDYEILVRSGPGQEWAPFLRGRYARISGH